MKQAALSFLFVALALRLQADDSPYQTGLRDVHERFRVLEVERNDYRKPKPELAPAKEEERQRLLGQLLTDDPVWTLAEEIQADIAALTAIRTRTPDDDAILDSLKDLLAIASSLEERATTHDQAKAFATALRQFVARRDAAGASAWARAQ